MDRMLYVAMSGAKHTMLAQAVNSHNMANMSTTGFRADLDAFRSLPVHGPGYATRVFATDESLGVDFTPGALVTTGRDMDMAIDGEGWLAVQAPDGSEAYTRAGDLRIGPGGLLVNTAGHPVLGEGGPIVIPPAEKMDIGTDGTITVQPFGQEITALTVVDRIKLVNPPRTQLEKGDDGLLRLKEGRDAPPDGAVKLVTGMLETSNVNAASSLVTMIALARQYEMHVKMMESAKDNDAASAQLMRLS